MARTNTRRRGGQPGNQNALRHGRASNEAVLERKEGAAFVKECLKSIRQLTTSNEVG